MDLSSAQKKKVRGLAQQKKATYQIGKNNITPALLAALHEGIAAHELVKIHVLQNATLSKEAILKTLEQALAVDYAYGIGNQLVLFKRASDKEKRKISTKL